MLCKIHNKPLGELYMVKMMGRPRKSNIKSYWIRHWALYAMLLLPIAFFFIFSYMPMINILIAFKRNNIIAPIMEVDWVGLDNFRWLLNNQQFFDAIRNTIMFSVLDLAIGFPAPIILALLLNEIKFRKFKRVTQTISYMPFFLSWVIIGGLASRLLAPEAGAVNNILMNNFGLESPIPFLSNDTYWVFTNVLFAVWRSLGWNTIIYLAAITAVNPELYEAADMDGASRLRKMWHVTLPGIRPVIVILFILTIGQIMGADMARFLAMENNLVLHVSLVMPIFVFRWGIQGLQYHRAAAAGLVGSIINLMLLFGANLIAKKLGGRGLW